MRRKLSLLLLVLAVLTLHSCKEADGGEYLSFSDGLGNVVSLDEKPTRVAVLM